MKNALYWIALQNILGYGANEIWDILRNFDDVSELFEKTIRCSDVKFLSDKKFKKLKAYDLKKAQSVIDYCDRKNIEIITVEDEKYPIVLKRIYNPPAVLYVRGELPDVDHNVGIGMVGTRKASMNSMIVAATLAYRIAQAGAVVVSGGAMGIDTRCSQGALFAKTPSIIVRPCGLDYNYLASLSDVRRQVENCGAVISEIQPLGKVERDAFQIRNRIIAALSIGIVAIEVPEQSGVLITVNYATEFGKDIFVVPGDITDENYRGSNKLLQDGAVPIYTPADVLNEYSWNYPLDLTKAGIPVNEDDIYLKLQKKYSKKNGSEIVEPEKQGKKKTFVSKVKDKLKKDKLPKKTNNKTEKPVLQRKKLSELPFSADENTKTVYSCFDNRTVSVDYISEKTGLEASDIMFALTELEINDVINSLPGGRFEIK